MQSFLSQTSVKTAEPEFEVEYNVVLQEGGANILHLMMHRVRHRDAFTHKNIGVGAIDLKSLLADSGRTQLREPNTMLTEKQIVVLMNPSDASEEVGTIEVSVSSTAPAELESNFWLRLIDLVDYDGSNNLNYEVCKIGTLSLMKIYSNTLLRRNLSAGTFCPTYRGSG